MKKILKILVFGLFLISTSQADDIRDLQIEGMSVGDSLLDYMSVKDIKEEFEQTKDHYIYLKEPHKFREVYIFNSNFETYYAVSFYVKPNDKNYKIYFIRGLKNYMNSMDKCLEKRDEIGSEIENIIPVLDKDEIYIKSSLDKSGRSFHKQLIFLLEAGDEIVLSCNDWEESLRKKNNWSEGLSVVIQKKEVSDWFKNRK